MEKLLGPKLQTKAGLKDTSAVLAGKSAVGIYFAASWSEASRVFTAALAERYLKAYKAKGMEIVFVSSDREQGASNAHYESDMPWAALPYEEKQIKVQLAARFKMRGIPTLAIVDGEGNTINNDVDEEVIMDDPRGVKMPWPAPTEAEAAAANLQALGPDLVARASGRPVLLYFGAPNHPPCREFTPTLVQMYEEGLRDNVEIVFASVVTAPAGGELKQGAAREAAHEEYAAALPFPALPFGGEAARLRLSKACGVRGIPWLSLLDARDGRVVAASATQCLMDDPAGALLAEHGTAGWAPKPFNDANKGANLMQLNLHRCVVALGGSGAMAAALEAVALEQYESAGGDVDAMPLRFLTAPDGPGADQLRGLAEIPAGDKLVVVDVPAGGKLYECEGVDDSMWEVFGESAVKAFLAGVEDGTVEPRQMARSGAPGGEICRHGTAGGSFAPCCAPLPPPAAAPGGGGGGYDASSLRFQVGDSVACNTGRGWTRGVIVAHNYRSQDGRINPYQIELENGGLIFAPADDDRMIRAAPPQKGGRRAVKASAPRFKVGAKVLCNTGRGWAPGVVIAHNWRSRDGRVHPYQIELADGDLIFAPVDDDRIIKNAPP
eukprot:g6455.t1